MCRSFIIIIYLFASLGAFSQKDVSNIEFTYTNERRSENRKTAIKIYRVKKSPQYQLSLVLKDVSKNTKDTTFNITKQKFEEVVKAVNDISCVNIMSDIGNDGMDGTSSEIKFGNFGSFITYHIWLPVQQTKERNLESYLNACKLILVIAGLNPEVILPYK